MKTKIFCLTTALSVISTAALAGGVVPIPVPEPGMIGIVAGGVVAAIAFARIRARR